MLRINVLLLNMSIWPTYMLLLQINVAKYSKGHNYDVSLKQPKRDVWSNNLNNSNDLPIKQSLCMTSLVVDMWAIKGVTNVAWISKGVDCFNYLMSPSFVISIESDSNRNSELNEKYSSLGYSFGHTVTEQHLWMLHGQCLILCIFNMSLFKIGVLRFFNSMHVHFSS